MLTNVQIFYFSCHIHPACALSESWFEYRAWQKTVLNLRHCLISYRAGAWHYLISMAGSQRIVTVKTRTKAFFFEEILINIPSENLPKLSKERIQYFCHALKLNLRSRHSDASASNCSMNRSLEPKMTINVREQKILCLILPASVL